MDTKNRVQFLKWWGKVYDGSYDSRKDGLYSIWFMGTVFIAAIVILVIYFVLINLIFPVLIGALATLASITAILFSASRSALGKYEQVFFYCKAKNLLKNVLILVLSFTLTFIYNQNHFPEKISNMKNWGFAEFLIGFYGLIITTLSTLAIISSTITLVKVYIHVISNIDYSFGTEQEIKYKEKKAKITKDLRIKEVMEEREKYRFRKKKLK